VPRLSRKRLALLLVGVVAATVLAGVVALNLGGPEKEIERRVGHRFAVGDPQFGREMGVLLGPAILPGNRIEDLQNGDAIFPAMLGAIGAASETITFETYIYWSGRIGREMADSLSAAARRGVAVHVLIDWVGGLKAEDALIDQMRDAGVDVELYRPLRWFDLDRLNNRTHRKLLVVDGRVGFTGGVGIADEWTGDAQDPDHWRDIHFRVEGPVVAQMQAAFLDNWIKTTGEILNGPAYFPPLEPAGPADAHVFVASPAGGSASMHLMYLMAVSAATRSIDLQAAYFVPDDLILSALEAARARGVRVRVIVPGEHIDTDLVRHASKALWGRLLDDGIEIYEYRPTMLHNKLLIVDGGMVSVGSTNFDVRSFELNDEASLNVYDTTFAARMTRVFEADLRQSRRYTRAMWERRPWTDRAKEWLARPFRSQL
jgi:cardiolipin synthase